MKERRRSSSIALCKPTNSLKGSGTAWSRMVKLWEDSGGGIAQARFLLSSCFLFLNYISAICRRATLTYRNSTIKISLCFNGKKKQTNKKNTLILSEYARLGYSYRRTQSFIYLFTLTLRHRRLNIQSHCPFSPR